MEIVDNATTIVETFAEERNVNSNGCDDVKCKLCEYYYKRAVYS